MKNNIEKIKFLTIDVNKDEKTVKYTAKVYDGNEWTNITESIMLNKKTDFYSNFKYNNISRLYEVISYWADQSKYLNRSNAVNLLFAIYKQTDLDAYAINTFFINELNN